MIVTIVGVGSETLVEAFDAARIEYARLRGVEMRAAQVVEIPKFSVPALAGIIIAWLDRRPSRIVTVTTKDDTRWHAGGKSFAEVEKLLIGAKEMMAVETEGLDAQMSDLLDSSSPGSAESAP